MQSPVYSIWSFLSYIFLPQSNRRKGGRSRNKKNLKKKSVKQKNQPNFANPASLGHQAWSNKASADWSGMLYVWWEAKATLSNTYEMLTYAPTKPGNIQHCLGWC